jgi:AraC-like DNA-binding protein/mannose-6-phosphate isomerase-like protein (cupin superfamily)
MSTHGESFPCNVVRRCRAGVRLRLGTEMVLPRGVVRTTVAKRSRRHPLRTGALVNARSPHGVMVDALPAPAKSLLFSGARREPLSTSPAPCPRLGLQMRAETTRRPNPGQNTARLAVIKTSHGFSKARPLHTGLCEEHDTLVKAHVHDGVELGAILSGKGYVYLDGGFYPCSAGDVCFINASLPHWHISQTGHDLALVAVHIPLERILCIVPDESDSRLFQPFTWQARGLSPILGNIPDVHAALCEVHRLHTERPPDWDLACWNKITAVFFEIALRTLPLVRSEQESQGAGPYDVVRRAIQYVHEHHAESFSRDDLARHCNLSASRLSHVFSQTMGMSFADYRMRVRVNVAVDRISNTDEKLFTIARSCGFGSESRLRSALAKVIGKTPSALRSGH